MRFRATFLGVAGRERDVRPAAACPGWSLSADFSAPGQVVVLRLRIGESRQAPRHDRAPRAAVPVVRRDASLYSAAAQPLCIRTHDRTVLGGGPARQHPDRDQGQSSGVRGGQGGLALRGGTSRYRGLPSSHRPRAVRGTVVTVNPDAVRSSRTACSGQVRCGAPTGESEDPGWPQRALDPGEQRGRFGGQECPSAQKLTARSKGPGEGQGPDVGPYPPGVRVRTARLREHASAEVDARDPALAQGFQDPHARAWWPVLPVSCPGESGPRWDSGRDCGQRRRAQNRYGGTTR